MSTMLNSYKEAPGVKKLRRESKLFPKETLAGTSGPISIAIGIAVVWLAITCMAMRVVSMAPINPWWAFSATTLISLPLILHALKPVIVWVLKSSKSPFVISRQRRTNINKARLLARQLGASVVPVLTAEHVQAIQTVHDELEAASNNKATDSARDYDRIAVLLLADLNREPLLLDLIHDRGHVTMDDIEAALKEIETNTITPLQDGWL